MIHYKSHFAHSQKQLNTQSHLKHVPSFAFSNQPLRLDVRPIIKGRVKVNQAPKVLKKPVHFQGEVEEDVLQECLERFKSQIPSLERTQSLYLDHLAKTLDFNGKMRLYHLVQDAHFMHTIKNFSFDAHQSQQLYRLLVSEKKANVRFLQWKTVKNLKEHFVHFFSIRANSQGAFKSFSRDEILLREFSFSPQHILLQFFEPYLIQGSFCYLQKQFFLYGSFLKQLLHPRGKASHEDVDFLILLPMQRESRRAFFQQLKDKIVTLLSIEMKKSLLDLSGQCLQRCQGEEKKEMETVYACNDVLQLSEKIVSDFLGNYQGSSSGYGNGTSREKKAIENLVEENCFRNLVFFSDESGALFTLGNGLGENYEFKIYFNKADVSQVPCFSFSSSCLFPIKQELLFIQDQRSFCEISSSTYLQSSLEGPLFASVFDQALGVLRIPRVELGMFRKCLTQLTRGNFTFFSEFTLNLLQPYFTEKSPAFPNPFSQLLRELSKHYCEHTHAHIFLANVFNASFLTKDPSLRQSLMMELEKHLTKEAACASFLGKVEDLFQGLVMSYALQKNYTVLTHGIELPIKSFQRGNLCIETRPTDYFIFTQHLCLQDLFELFLRVQSLLTCFLSEMQGENGHAIKFTVFLNRALYEKRILDKASFVQTSGKASYTYLGNSKDEDALYREDLLVLKRRLCKQWTSLFLCLTSQQRDAFLSAYLSKGGCIHSLVEQISGLEENLRKDLQELYPKTWESCFDLFKQEHLMFDQLEGLLKFFRAFSCHSLFLDTLLKAKGSCSMGTLIRDYLKKSALAFKEKTSGARKLQSKKSLTYYVFQAIDRKEEADFLEVLQTEGFDSFLFSLLDSSSGYRDLAFEILQHLDTTSLQLKTLTLACRDLSQSVAIEAKILKDFFKEKKLSSLNCSFFQELMLRLYDSKKGQRHLLTLYLLSYTQNLSHSAFADSKNWEQLFHRALETKQNTKEKEALLHLALDHNLFHENLSPYLTLMEEAKDQKTRRAILTKLLKRGLLRQQESLNLLEKLLHKWSEEKKLSSLDLRGLLQCMAQAGYNYTAFQKMLSELAKTEEKSQESYFSLLLKNLQPRDRECKELERFFEKITSQYPLHKTLSLWNQVLTSYKDKKYFSPRVLKKTEELCQQAISVKKSHQQATECVDTCLLMLTPRVSIFHIESLLLFLHKMGETPFLFRLQYSFFEELFQIWEEESKEAFNLEKLKIGQDILALIFLVDKSFHKDFLDRFFIFLKEQGHLCEQGVREFSKSMEQYLSPEKQFTMHCDLIQEALSRGVGCGTLYEMDVCMTQAFSEYEEKVRKIPQNILALLVRVNACLFMEYGKFFDHPKTPYEVKELINGYFKGATQELCKGVTLMDFFSQEVGIAEPWPAIIFSIFFARFQNFDTTLLLSTALKNISIEKLSHEQAKQLKQALERNFTLLIRVDDDAYFENLSYLLEVYDELMISPKKNKKKGKNKVKKSSLGQGESNYKNYLIHMLLSSEFKNAHGLYLQGEKVIKKELNRDNPVFIQWNQRRKTFRQGVIKRLLGSLQTREDFLKLPSHYRSLVIKEMVLEPSVDFSFIVSTCIYPWWNEIQSKQEQFLQGFMDKDFSDAEKTQAWIYSAIDCSVSLDRLEQESNISLLKARGVCLDKEKMQNLIHFSKNLQDVYTSQKLPKKFDLHQKIQTRGFVSFFVPSGQESSMQAPQKLVDSHWFVVQSQRIAVSVGELVKKIEEFNQHGSFEEREKIATFLNILLYVSQAKIKPLEIQLTTHEMCRLPVLEERQLLDFFLSMPGLSGEKKTVLQACVLVLFRYLHQALPMEIFTRSLLELGNEIKTQNISFREFYALLEQLEQRGNFKPYTLYYHTLREGLFGELMELQEKEMEKLLKDFQLGCPSFNPKTAQNELEYRVSKMRQDMSYLYNYQKQYPAFFKNTWEESFYHYIKNQGLAEALLVRLSLPKELTLPKSLEQFRPANLSQITPEFVCKCFALLCDVYIKGLSSHSTDNSVLFVEHFNYVLKKFLEGTCELVKLSCISIFAEKMMHFVFQLMSQFPHQREKEAFLDCCFNLFFIDLQRLLDLQASRLMLHAPDQRRFEPELFLECRFQSVNLWGCMGKLFLFVKENPSFQLLRKKILLKYLGKQALAQAMMYSNFDSPSQEAFSLPSVLSLYLPGRLNLSDDDFHAFVKTFCQTWSLGLLANVQTDAVKILDNYLQSVFVFLSDITSDKRLPISKLITQEFFVFVHRLLESIEHPESQKAFLKRFFSLFSGFQHFLHTNIIWLSEGAEPLVEQRKEFMRFAQIELKKFQRSIADELKGFLDNLVQGMDLASSLQKKLVPAEEKSPSKT